MCACQGTFLRNARHPLSPPMKARLITALGPLEICGALLVCSPTVEQHVCLCPSQCVIASPYIHKNLLCLLQQIVAPALRALLTLARRVSITMESPTRESSGTSVQRLSSISSRMGSIIQRSHKRSKGGTAQSEKDRPTIRESSSTTSMAMFSDDDALRSRRRLQQEFMGAFPASGGL